jgi:hypothetical protein
MAFAPVCHCERSAAISQCRSFFYHFPHFFHFAYCREAARKT